MVYGAGKIFGGPTEKIIRELILSQTSLSRVQSEAPVRKEITETERDGRFLWSKREAGDKKKSTWTILREGRRERDQERGKWKDAPSIRELEVMESIVDAVRRLRNPYFRVVRKASCSRLLPSH